MATKKIFFDPGHRNSAFDWGAAGNGLREAELTLKIVNYAVKYLNAHYMGFEVKQSRTSNDQIVDLNKRDDLANDWGADAFISVHINAAGGTGFETFIFDGVTSQATKDLQTKVHDEILAAMKKFDPKIKDRGKKKANHSVTRTTDMPAVLTESLFIDSEDSKLLKDEAFLKSIGEAHARGVANHLKVPLKIVEQASIGTKPSSKPKGEFNLLESAGKVLDEEFVAMLEGAHKAGILSSKDWAQKAKEGKLTEVEAIKLHSAIIRRTYFKDVEGGVK